MYQIQIAGQVLCDETDPNTRHYMVAMLDIKETPTDKRYFALMSGYSMFKTSVISRHNIIEVKDSRSLHDRFHKLRNKKVMNDRRWCGGVNYEGTAPSLNCVGSAVAGYFMQSHEKFKVAEHTALAFKTFIDEKTQSVFDAIVKEKEKSIVEPSYANWGIF